MTHLYLYELCKPKGTLKINEKVFQKIYTLSTTFKTAKNKLFYTSLSRRVKKLQVAALELTD